MGVILLGLVAVPLEFDLGQWPGRRHAAQLGDALLQFGRLVGGMMSEERHLIRAPGAAQCRPVATGRSLGVDLAPWRD
jgi:hypothetical protein